MSSDSPSRVRLPAALAAARSASHPATPASRAASHSASSSVVSSDAANGASHRVWIDRPREDGGSGTSQLGAPRGRYESGWCESG
eukprot:scaffold27437_cov96-Isochrysis_galbana.AAC.2